MDKLEIVYAEISDVLEGMEQKSSSAGCGTADAAGLKSRIVELKDQIKMERNDYMVSFL